MIGYLTDLTCPTSPDHGNTLYYENGRHCPHEEHYFPTITQNYWSHAEFETLKSPNPGEPHQPIKTTPKIKKLARRSRSRKR